MAGQWHLEEVTMFDLSPTGTTTLQATHNKTFDRPGYEFFGLKTYASVNAGNYTLLFQMRGSSAYGATGQSLVWKEVQAAGGAAFMTLNGSGVKDTFQLFGISNTHNSFVVLPEEVRLRFTAATPTNTDVVQITAFIGKPFGG